MVPMMAGALVKRLPNVCAMMAGTLDERWINVGDNGWVNIGKSCNSPECQYCTKLWSQCFLLLAQCRSNINVLPGYTHAYFKFVLFFTYCYKRPRLPHRCHPFRAPAFCVLNKSGNVVLCGEFSTNWKTFR